MVLLSAAICRKNGNTILSRQFVEMTRSRIEGLLAAFPKLMNTGKQHTFVETESVRYVYQPLEKMYMLLITTKNSNILEDLETLRLFSRVIPEYCQKIDEQSVQDNAYELIFAFDEVVALGYRESVNLAQIRTFTEMDSHDEKLHKAVRETQMAEAKQQMRAKAKELQQQKMQMNRAGGRSLTSNSMGFGSSMKSSSVGSDIITAQAIPEPVSKPAPKRTTKNAMKLGGGKHKDVDKFVDNLRSEGQQVRSAKTTKKEAAVVAATTNQVKQESAHVKISEKLMIEATRNGDYEVRVLGELALHINDEDCNKIRVLCDVNSDGKNFKFQTHPNVVKYSGSSHVIGMRNGEKPFPLNQDVNVLKWKLQSDDETHVPLQINCWPDEDGSGNCDVNIEYELIMTSHELNDVTISIPVPSGVQPNVSDCGEGDYKHDSRKNLLVWTVPVIDDSNASGILNFTIPSCPDDFYPVNVQFSSTKQSYTDIQIKEVQQVETKEAVRFSVDRIMYADKYEVA